MNPTPEQLKTARESAGLTQSQAATLLGTSQTIVSRNERGGVGRISLANYRLLLALEYIPPEIKSDWLNLKADLEQQQVAAPANP